MVKVVKWHKEASMALAREITGQERDDLIESLGGEERIREGLSWYGERCELYDRRREELTEKYPDRYVALAADDTIVAAKTLDEVFEELDRRGLEREPCVVEFLSAEPEIWIL